MYLKFDPFTYGNYQYNPSTEAPAPSRADMALQAADNPAAFRIRNDRALMAADNPQSVPYTADYAGLILDYLV